MRTGALDQALDERQKLLASYRRIKRRELNELLADPCYGSHLRRFLSVLRNNFNQPSHAPLMLRFLERECTTWLSGADAKWRGVALEAIGNRSAAIRERTGQPPFDDPLPGEPDNVFLEAKRMLGL